MSSHREAPEISKDPVADSTDVYAFVSPDKPDTVTLIANYVPLQEPAGGPNFYEFGDDVLYAINIDNNGDGQADISYQFRFTTDYQIPTSFLYNDGPIEALNSPNWNRRQFFSISVSDGYHEQTLASNLACPPCNIGPLSTPNYPALADEAVHNVDGILVFAGQRAEAFYVDLGSIFDLGDLRPFEAAHATFGLPSLPTAPGVNATKFLNVHSIAIQVPISALVKKGHPTIGVWTTASRQRAQVWDAESGQTWSSGPWRQVSRLGNPLFNEVLVPIAKKDLWNSLPPSDDKSFASYVTQPELATLLPVLYPGVFPHLAALVAAKTARADLEAILLTGIPSGIVPGFTNYTGSVLADMLRLNTSIAPNAAGAGKQSIYGLLGGDPAGYPNGRRVTDDVVAIELRAIAGVTYALVDKSYTPDAAASAVTDGLTNADTGVPTQSLFPYLANPYDGYHHPDPSPSS
jgi:hypothetical protein